MASGEKNYFRHVVNARNDDFIISLMEKFSFQGYFMWFALIECCAELMLDGQDQPYTFHKSFLMKSLRCNQDKLDKCLAYAQDKCRISYTKAEDKYNLEIVNLPKFVGNFSKKTPNKRKEKERKEKEIKEKEKQVSSVSFDAVNDLYTRKIAKPHYKPSFLTPNSVDVKNFILCGEFIKTESDWENYFNLVLSSSFLMGRKFTLNLTRLLDPVFASNVLNGKYTSSSDVLEDALEKELG